MIIDKQRLYQISFLRQAKQSVMALLFLLTLLISPQAMATPPLPEGGEISVFINSLDYDEIQDGKGTLKYKIDFPGVDLTNIKDVVIETTIMVDKEYDPYNTLPPVNYKIVKPFNELEYHQIPRILGRTFNFYLVELPFIVESEGAYRIISKVSLTDTNDQLILNHLPNANNSSFMLILNNQMTVGAINTYVGYKYCHLNPELCSETKALVDIVEAAEQTARIAKHENNIIIPESKDLILKKKELKILLEKGRKIQDKIEKEVNQQINERFLRKKQTKVSTPLSKDEIITLNYQIELESTLVNIDDAKIEIKDTDTNIIIETGVTQNGEYKYIVPYDNANLSISLFAENKTIRVRDNNDHNNQYPTISKTIDNGDLVAQPCATDYCYSIIFDENFDKSKDLDGGWFIFVAAVELNKLALSELSISKKSYIANYDISEKNAYYLNKEIVIGSARSTQWDTVAHEFGHAVDDEIGAIFGSQGGEHDGSNQYDYQKNTYTYNNKTRSLMLSFSEGFASWLGVNLFEKSKYVGTIPSVGDKKHNSFNLEKNDDSPFRGEDTERAVFGILWDTSDAISDNNLNAVCNECKDSISISVKELINNVFLSGNKNGNISNFYSSLFKYKTGKLVDNFSKVGTISSNDLYYVNNFGMTFAEFGVAPGINEADNDKTMFLDFDSSTITNFPKFTWKQFKTGSMPGLDEFEILFFNGNKDKLLYKIIKPNVTSLGSNPTVYEYELTYPELNDLYTAIKDDDVSSTNSSQEILVMIKGIASKTNGANAANETGPYISNYVKFDLGKRRYSVVVVDDSGSNTSTDSANLRGSAANATIANAIKRNQQFDTAAKNDPNILDKKRKISLAATIFTTYSSLLSGLNNPEKIKNIYNGKLYSYGGTDIAWAIYDAIQVLTPNGNKRSDPQFKDSIYLLTDFDNNAGIFPVTNAIYYANSLDIRTHIGHLVPLIKSAQPVSGEINGDPVNTTKGYEPFDAVIEAVLAGGGSYTQLLNAASQLAWVELVDYLDNTPPAEIYANGIELPVDVQVYGMAEAGKEIVTYYHNVANSAEFKVTVDGKGMFTPETEVVLTSNGQVISGTQTALANDFYEITFEANAGERVDILIGRTNLADAGLYSVVLTKLRNTTGVTRTDTRVEKIPATSLYYLLIISALFIVLAYARRRYKHY